MPFINSNGDPVDAPEATVFPVDQLEFDVVTAPAAVSLDFESAADGRAFSVAGLLRSEGYLGQLIGTGEIGLDRVAYGFRVGFDLLWLSDDELSLLTAQHLQPFPHHYQRPIEAATSEASTR